MSLAMHTSVCSFITTYFYTTEEEAKEAFLIDERKDTCEVLQIHPILSTERTAPDREVVIYNDTKEKV